MSALSTFGPLGLCLVALAGAALLFAGCGRGDGAGAGRQTPTGPAAGGGPQLSPAVEPPAAPARWDVSVAPTPGPGASVRRPAVAGAFYPGNAEALRRDIAARLEKAGKPPELPGRLRAIIVPHAGYVYSADTAAAAFAAAKGRGFDRAVVIGCPHRVAVRTASVATDDFFRTPLGPVAVDREFGAKLAEKAGAEVGVDLAAHEEEHSLEVELPFLQTVIGPGVRVVPVLVSGEGDAAAERLAAALAELVDERTLVVVSTDLAHYPSQAVAEKVDAETVESWKTLDAAKVAAVEHRLMAAGHDNLDCTMCGSGAVGTLMRLAPLIGIDSVTVLRTDTSATAGSDRSRVVGYGSAAFCASGKAGAGKTPASGQAATDDLAKPPQLSAGSRVKLLQIAREAATAALSGRRPSKLDLAALPEDCRQAGGAFVTLHNRGQLRGCIGRFEGQCLAEVIQAMAVASATQDTRFADDPVTAAEMKEIDIEISALSPMRPIADWRAIRLGVHGVVVGRGWNRGVYLPQVATETGWTLEEFLSHLCRDKAGLPPDAYRQPGTEIQVFTALVFGEKEAATGDGTPGD